MALHNGWYSLSTIGPAGLREAGVDWVHTASAFVEMEQIAELNILAHKELL